MSVPKKRKSKTATREGRSHQALKSVTAATVQDPSSSHRANPSRRTKQGRDIYDKRSSAK